MHRTVTDQIKSGIQLGLGLGFFLVGWIFLGLALRHISTDADWIGWLELSGALMLLYASAQVWSLLVAGIALFGTFKSLAAFIGGYSLYSPYPSLPRISAIGLTAFCLVTLILLFRFARSMPALPKLTVADRSALTCYVVTLLWLGKSIFIPVLGLAALACSWALHWWTTRRRNSSARLASQNTLVIS